MPNKKSGDVNVGDSSNITTGDHSDIIKPKESQSEGGVVIGDVVLKVNAMTINLDDQTVSKLIEVIELLRENQVLLLNKIDLVEISILNLGKDKETNVDNSVPE